jgi:glycosyltransferase involved in cell wall biosynthesis
MLGSLTGQPVEKNRMKLSVVIICKNEAAVIGHTISRIQPVSNDIVVVDTGSTDGTVALMQQLPVKLLQIEWPGFGPAKNTGIAAAQHDWILSLDADELADATLVASIQQANDSNENVVYKLPFRNYLGEKGMQHGEWGYDSHIRLFNRRLVSWNDAVVHEELILPPNVVIQKLKGFIHHKTAADAAELRQKMEHYARLNAEKYFRQGKKPSLLKLVFSPVVNFVSNYLFRLGFLDGGPGFTVARESARYTRLKYQHLAQLWRHAG